MRITKLFILFALSLFLLNSCKDACEDIDCGTNGTCLDGSCNCDEGYSGENCEINVCDNKDCGPNGSCNGTTGACECDEGYSGDNCEINVCDTVDCGPNGSCDTSSGACICNEGYEGNNCETEIRSKYYGTYEGDMVPCVPGLLAALIPADQLESLETTPLEVFDGPSSIHHVTIGASNTVLDLNIEADTRNTDFVIPEFSQEVNVGGTGVTVSGNGTGKLLDENSMELTFDLNYKVDILNVGSDCSVIFAKI